MKNIDITVTFQVSDNVTTEMLSHVAYAMKVQAEEPLDEDSEDALWLPESVVTMAMVVDGIEVSV